MVLEIQSQIVCQSGFEEEPELQWKDDVKRAMEPCRWVGWMGWGGATCQGAQHWSVAAAGLQRKDGVVSAWEPCSWAAPWLVVQCGWVPLRPAVEG